MKKSELLKLLSEINDDKEIKITYIETDCDGEDYCIAITEIEDIKLKEYEEEEHLELI